MRHGGERWDRRPHSTSRIHGCLPGEKAYPWDEPRRRAHTCCEASIRPEVSPMLRATLLCVVLFLFLVLTANAVRVQG